MKKILFLIGIIALFAFSVQAQDYTVARNGTHFNIALDASDTISNNSTTLSKIIGVGNKQSVQLYSIEVSLDKISGTPTQAWVLAGSLDNSNWTTITTVNWAGTVDTVFHYTDISTGVAWSYLRVKGTESGTGKALLDKLIGRVIDEVR